jgi:hypothetical protein
VKKSGFELQETPRVRNDAKPPFEIDMLVEPLAQQVPAVCCGLVMENDRSLSGLPQ